MRSAVEEARKGGGTEQVAGLMNGGRQRKT